jgi:toxin ParE1/3/4
MRRYRLSRLARADLDQIWLYIARNSTVETADRFIDRITKQFVTLAGAPDAGAVRDEIELGLRSFSVGRYLIYYRRAQRGEILISRVIHGMRDQQGAWDEE